MYYLSRRICGRYQILPCILLAGTYFGSSWPAISHHVDSNCFALLAVACMIAWQDKRKDGLLFAAGALAGATTCFFNLRGCCCCLPCWCGSGCSTGGVQASLIAAMGQWLEVTSAWLRSCWFISGAGTHFGISFYANVLWPSQHYSAVNVVPYAQGIIHYYWDHFVIAKSGFRWTIVTASVLIAPFLFVAALPALLPVLAARFIRNNIPSRRFSLSGCVDLRCGCRSFTARISAIWYSDRRC